MAGKSRLAVLNLTVEEKQRLDALRHSRTASLRTVERANILWHYHAGLNPSEIKQAAKVSRVTVYACLRKALAMGLEAGLKDAFHRPKEPRIDHILLGIAELNAAPVVHRWKKLPLRYFKWVRVGAVRVAADRL